MRRFFIHRFVLLGIILFVPLIACQCQSRVEEAVKVKTSSLLLTQVSLRKEQTAEPTPERLEIMKAMGMRVDNLEIQRIFIHLTKELNPLQVEELEATGITLYLDSWIPPVGAHPTGFLTADMPIDKLEELAEKDYVVRLETAERQLKPQNGSHPQVE